VLHTAITIHHFSLFYSELKTYHSENLILLIAHRFYVLVNFFSVLVIPMCGKLIWPALVNFLAHEKLSAYLLID